MILTMFMIASRQSSQPAVAWAGHLRLHSLCLIPRNLLDDISVFGDLSFLQLLPEGSRAHRLEKCSFRGKHHAPIKATVSMSSVLSWAKASCASKRWQRGIRIWSSCVIRPLPRGPLWVQVDCQTSVLWTHCGRTHSADPRTLTKLHLHRPSLFRLAGHLALGVCILSWLCLCDNCLMLMCGAPATPFGGEFRDCIFLR